MLKLRPYGAIQIRLLLLLLLLLWCYALLVVHARKEEKEHQPTSIFQQLLCVDESWQFALFTSSARRFLNIDILLGSLATFYEMLDI